MRDLAIAVGSVAFLYSLSTFGFSKWVKELIFNKQGGVSPTGQPIDEYHHIVPENMLKRSMGISGKNVPENCVGLGYEEHKRKWDQLASEGIFYPGVSIDQIDPDTYTTVQPKRNKHKPRRRR